MPPRPLRLVAPALVATALLANCSSSTPAPPSTPPPMTSTAPGPLRGAVAVSGLASPVAFVQDSTDPTVQYVVEQGGRIRVVQSGRLLLPDFLDLSRAISSGGERGLLGLAFPPDDASSGRFYVNFTNTSGDTVVARFKRSPDRLTADPGSRFDLLWSTGERVIRQPYANHNGGNLAFGPDGFLYIGMGDGGGADDPGNRAQDPTTLLGKMLRIDVNVPDTDERGFRVPAGNPFLSGQPLGALPEIWDFGLRNPWRFSFDDPTLGGTGALVIGDVGQNWYEEIDYEPPGAGGRNYGWRLREGAHPRVTTLPPAFLPLIDPIIEYRPRRRHRRRRRLHLPRPGARCRIRGPLFLRGFERPGVVGGAAIGRRVGCGDSSGPDRAHRGVGRCLGARERLVLRGGCWRRGLSRQRERWDSRAPAPRIKEGRARRPAPLSHTS